VYDNIKTQLDTLSELSDEQVGELQSEIVSQFEAVEGEEPTPETVDAMTSLADSLDIVRGELSRREALAEQLAAQAAEATARVKGTTEDASQEEDMAMTDNSEMAEAPMDENPAEAPVEGTPQEEAGETPVQEAAEPVAEDAAPADAAPAEGAPAEGTPEEEAKETPADEEEEMKKKATSEYSSDSDDASIAQVEGSEFSTDKEQDVVVEETTVADAPEGSEASIQENSLETSIAPEEQKEQAPVTASAEQPFEAPADRQPVIQVTEAPVAITAGADIPGYTAGSSMNDMYEVASAMEKRIHSLRRVNGGDGEQHIVASITTQFPEERILTTDALSNAKKIAAVSGPEALVAAGGISTPFEVKYDIYSIGSTNVRPLRDSLPRFQADRGGIRFITPPTFANVTSNTTTYSSAVGLWTNSVDSGVTYSSGTPSSTKTSLTVAAATENTVGTDAVTLQLQFGNMMTRAYPELIARHNELALVQHAREAEENLVAGINAGSTAVTTTNLIGFGRDFLVQVRRAATAYRSRHRLGAEARLRLVIPFWVYDAMAADLTLAMPGDGTLAVSRSEVDGYLSNLNVDVVTILDNTSWTTAATNLANTLDVYQAAGALNEFPDTFKWFLFSEGTFLFLDGGTLDLGIIRDSSLVGTNDYKMFIETFEAVAKVGIESLAITSTISVNGVAAALRDTTGGTTAATIEL
jgi:hypothetical protein